MVMLARVCCRARRWQRPTRGGRIAGIKPTAGWWSPWPHSLEVTAALAGGGGSAQRAGACACRTPGEAVSRVNPAAALGLALVAMVVLAGGRGRARWRQRPTHARAGPRSQSYGASSLIARVKIKREGEYATSLIHGCSLWTNQSKAHGSCVSYMALPCAPLGKDYFFFYF